MYFQKLIVSSLATALIAGLIFSGYQSLFISPIIFQAETHEQSEDITVHNQPASIINDTWEPKDGSQRSFYTVASNFLAGFGFTLLLASAMAFHGNNTLVKGLCWGLAGYVCFFVAPGLGLPPEIPGAEAADLEGRQIWWLATVLLSASGLALLVFSPLLMKTGGVLLLLLPHLIGAPQPEIHGFIHPDPAVVQILTTLWQQFIIQTSIANGLFWLIIGGLTGLFSNRFIDTIEPPINKQA